MKTKSTEQIHIENFSKSRYEFLEKFQSSWEPESEEYEIEEPKEIDELAEQILEYIKSWRHALPFEFIIEELTKLGWAPCLLYDDNGNFAISGEGMQTISAEGVDSQELFHFIEKDMWKPTIREALNYYLDEDDKP